MALKESVKEATRLMVVAAVERAKAEKRVRRLRDDLNRAEIELAQAIAAELQLQTKLTTEIQTQVEEDSTDEPPVRGNAR